MSNFLCKAFFLALLAGASLAQRATFYLFSELGCVDTVRMRIDRFDWSKFPEHDMAFIEADSKSDEWAYLIKAVEKNRRYDGVLARYVLDWRGRVSNDSLRILLGKPDDQNLRFIPANLLFDETDDDSLPYRFYKPDMLTLSSRQGFHYVKSWERHPVLVFTDEHYPDVAWLSFHEEPEEIRLEPIEFAFASVSFRGYNIERFRLIRKRPLRKKWKSSDAWCRVPMLLDDDYNEFSARKFGFWGKSLSLRADEQKSLFLKQWLYLNPSMVWAWESGRPNGPWPSDIVLGFDISGIIPGNEKAVEIGIDYELVISPFPTAGKAGITWFYGDWASIDLYYLTVFDSNPFRHAGQGFIAEAELSGKMLLGNRAWKYFPIVFRGGYGTGRTFHPSIYRIRFLGNESAQYARGNGGYFSAGLELWFLRSALLRPMIEAGIAFGNGSTRTAEDEVISRSDSDDERMFPFLRINFKP
ncbi:MAG TPA: hypothetical protein ENN07_05450 [candidate division Zixibacteria bacterium]|nr:hypothetical protein [candidate division Zixibacteria bacterium]